MEVSDLIDSFRFAVARIFCVFFVTSSSKMMVVVQEGKSVCTFQEDPRNSVITRHLSVCCVTTFML